MKVKNLNGTSDITPSGFNSWKEFYTHKHGYWPSVCSCLGCSRNANVGAHVKKVGSYDERWYIAPLCYYHNNQFGEELEVVDCYLEPVN